MAQSESTILTFEKVPTKGFRLEALDERYRRARIPGGWLVTIRDEGITFVPDPKHEWDGGSTQASCLHFLHSVLM